MFIIYGQFGPALCSKGHEFHSFGIGLLMFMYLCNHAPSFFSLQEWKQRERFLNMWSILHIYPCHPWVERSQLSQFRLILIQRCYKTNVVIIGLVVSKKTFEISDRAQPTHDDGRRPNTTCHLIDSGYLKRKLLCCIYFRTKTV